MKRLLIGLLALSMTAASCNLLTGSFDMQSGSKGVFKSEDNAESFHAANTISKKNDISGVSVNVLVPNPQNSDMIYLGYSTGIYRTGDAAGTWQQILSGMGVADIAVDPQNGDVIYAAGTAESNGKIVRSEDGGGSWNGVYTEPTKASPVTSVAVARNNSSLVLAGLATGEIIRSLDQGKTWQITQDLGDRVVRIRQVGNNFYALLLHKGLARSGNQGLAWTILQPKGLQRTITQPNSGSVSRPAEIETFNDLALDQSRPGTIYLGTNQGLIRSSNDGNSWSFVTMPVMDSNLSVSAVAVVPGDSNGILAAIGPVIFKSTNGGATWENKRLTTDQTVRTILINQQAPNNVYLGLGVKK